MVEDHEDAFKPVRDKAPTSAQADGGGEAEDKSSSTTKPFKKKRFGLKSLQSGLFDVLKGAAFSSFVGGAKHLGDRAVDDVVSASASFVSCLIWQQEPVLLDSCLLFLDPIASHYMFFVLYFCTYITSNITFYKTEEDVVVAAGGEHRVGEIDLLESLVGTGGVKASGL